MKKVLVGLFTLIAISIGMASFAACPCQQSCAPCCSSFNPCCEDWLNCMCVEDYLCRIGLNECQKAQARCAIEQFKCDTACNRAKDCQCESKCECREYKKALRDLDCKMKQIITCCQKDDYKCVKNEIKDKVKCCHKCLINPFHRCKTCDKGCPCGCACPCGK